MFSATRIMRASSREVGSPLAIAARGTPGTLDESSWQYDETTDTGYYGFVPASEFITGLELETLTGFTNGIDQNSDAGWLKFYVGPTSVCNNTPGTAKVIFVAKMTLKNTVGWSNINAAGLADGSSTFSILAQTYNVRLITGGLSSPGTESEWNELMYRIHSTQPEGKSNWATFANADLNINVGNGRYAWAQEEPSVGKACVRGYTSISHWESYTNHYATAISGWRPVLEYAP